MQNKTAKIPLILSTVAAGVAVFLRFRQLLFFTDNSTGFVVPEGEIYSYWIYGLIFCSAALCLVFAFRCRCTAPGTAQKPQRKIAVFAFLNAGAFFADFVLQAFDCFNYIENTAYLERNELVLMVLLGAFALLSSFYYITVGMTLSGSQYDFRSFRFFHFVPVLWAVIRLLDILVEMVNVSMGTETVVEFIFLVFLLMFYFSFITAAVSERNAGRGIVFFALVTFMLSVILELPGIITSFIGRQSELSDAVFSRITDLICGLFAASFAGNLLKRSRE